MKVMARYRECTPFFSWRDFVCFFPSEGVIRFVGVLSSSMKLIPYVTRASCLIIPTRVRNPKRYPKTGNPFPPKKIKCACTTTTQLHSDESPLSSLDSGMGDKMADGHHHNSNDHGVNSNDHHRNDPGTTNNGYKNSSGNSTMNTEKMREHETAMVSMYGAQGMDLAMPPDGGVPLLQVCRETHTFVY